MVEVVRSGTGRRAAIPRLQVAGKTGTSVIGEIPANRPQLAMFAGFAPADHPEYVAFVIAEDALNSEGEKIGGGAAAAPIFREVIRRSLSLQ